MTRWGYIDFLLMAVAMLAAVPAHSQSVLPHTNKPGHWYSPSCCSLNDCEPLPAEAVEGWPDGWHVHYHAKRGLIVDAVVPYGKERDSQDGRFHGCATPLRFLCLYVPRVS